MTVLDLEAPPIDRARAGILSITPHVIAELLRLPKGIRATACDYDFDDRCIKLTLEGQPMPERLAGFPRRVSLMFNVEQDAEKRETRWLYWSHRPEDRWLLRGPDPKPEGG
jgi:hypothetical protein